MLQAMLVCEAALGGAAQGGNAVHAGNSNSMHGPGSAHGGAAAKGGSAGKEEGAATLLQYRTQLPDVRVADDHTSKDVLGLLFQLVQMQIRKAEKFREVCIARHARSSDALLRFYSP